jgi:hypothetical protein
MDCECIHDFHNRVKNCLKNCLVSPEILTQIFCLTCAYGTGDFTLASLAPLLNVCVYWHNVISGFANFWRIVDICIFDNDEGQRLSVGRNPFGILSKDKNVKIAQNGPSWDPFLHFMAPLPFFNAIIPHIHDLKLESQGYCLQNWLESSITFPQPSSEVWLHNQCRHSNHNDATTMNYHWLYVQRVSMTKVNCIFQSDCVGEVSFSCISVSNAYTILSQCPNLFNAFFRDITDPSDGNDVFPWLLHEHLEDLSLVDCEGCLELLIPLRLPKLKTLTIEVYGEYQKGSIVSKIFQAIGRRLWVGDITLRHVYEEDMEGIATVLPNARVYQRVY